MQQVLRAGVAGAGAFGAHHAAKYAADGRVTLAAIFDVHRERAAALAQKYGAIATDDYADFLRAVDLATIATPAIAHSTYARAALMAGRHALVEKPLATTVESGADVVEAARTHGLVLACGHQERLVFEQMGLLDLPERPLLIEAVREGPWTGRGADVSVTLDLVVHDADLAMRLLGGTAPDHVSARGAIVQSESFDAIEAEAAIGDAVVRLRASRVAPERRRTMRVAYPSGEIRIDFVSRSFANETPFALNAAFAETPVGRDPLGANVARFIDAATGVAPRPAVTGEEALQALTLALAIDAAAAS